MAIECPNTWKTLKRFLEVQSGEEELTVLFTYERLPIFFYGYGVLGHIVRDCGQNTKSEHQYGAWLRESATAQQFRSGGMEPLSDRGVSLGGDRVVRTAPRVEGAGRGIRIFNSGR
ncbi:UNVERIFIED_CONTAM: hypothetical protein Slati_3929500 [Sesamum latifolium]|uniref:Zinc knuckle CX2CX4HX4C domain-containing protein n=1 Tax=Sesamum latifolium TaxID=2727402 RepID=A0AAW2TRD1_9LAMI